MTPGSTSPIVAVKEPAWLPRFPEQVLFQGFFGIVCIVDVSASNPSSGNVDCKPQHGGLMWQGHPSAQFCCVLFCLRQRLKHRQSKTVCLRGGFCSLSPSSLVLDPPRYFNLLMLSRVRVSVIYSKVSSFCTCSGKSPLVTSTGWPVFAIGKETVGQFHVFTS